MRDSMKESEEEIYDPKCVNWPPSNPTQCLTQLLISKDMDMVDLTIIIPGYENTFKAHRMVLGMWSSVFKAMLYGPMADGHTITLAEDSPEAFTWLLNYMYTGEINLSSMDLTLQVYLIADKYLMKHLKEVCSNYLFENVTASSLPEVINVASLMEDEILITKCAETLGDTPDSLFSSPIIGTLTSESMKQLLLKNLPVSSESVIFQGVLNWGKSKLLSKQEEVTTVTLRGEIDLLLPYVRFLSMSLDEFVKHVIREKILTWVEIEAIQLNIAGVPEISLPPSFSPIKDNRTKFDKSLLKIINIKYGTMTREIGKLLTAPILIDIQSSKLIHLKKLEYERSINIHGTLTVTNYSRTKTQTVSFDGKRAEFDIPFKMIPYEKYHFWVDTEQEVETLYQIAKPFSIENNGIISGTLVVNFCQPFDMHYWNHFS